jgi:hypothetical protein
VFREFDLSESNPNTLNELQKEPVREFNRLGLSHWTTVGFALRRRFSMAA